LGYLVEVIAKMPFNEYCNKNIFDPLGMKNTRWRLTEYSTHDNIAIPYEKDHENNLIPM